MYERPRVNVKVSGSTFTFTRDLSYIVYFIYSRKIYVRTQVKIMRQRKSTFIRVPYRQIHEQADCKEKEKFSTELGVV